jgi:sialate O-acetylesterase
MNKFFVVSLAGFLLTTSSLLAAPRLHTLFADHAVLQRNTPVPVWGWAEPGEAITVTCGGQTHRTTTDTQGKWTVTLTAMPAGGPYDLAVEGKGRQVAKDILFGDVWLCGGQSNMEYGMNHIRNANEELAKADFPQIRMFMPSPYGRDNMPQANLTGNWTPVSPNKVMGSALGYLFAREIHTTQKVPVGAIHCAVGATAAEWWLSREAVMTIPELQPKLQEGDRLCDAYASKVEAWEKLYQQAVSSARKVEGPTPLPPPLPDGDPRRADFHRPTFLYNGMVAPLIRFPIKGIIFYHGENHANPEKASLYHRLFSALIADWRRAWQRPDLPFLYVQLANHRRTTWEALCEVREAQRQALAIPHTGMAVAIDVGDVGDVHCKNKQEIARRLALIAGPRCMAKPWNIPAPCWTRWHLTARKYR